MAVSAIELAEVEGFGIALSSVSLYEMARIFHQGRVELKGLGKSFLIIFTHVF
jgi:PIN domain nuclease of toxin-antitoxin system